MKTCTGAETYGPIGGPDRHGAAPAGSPAAARCPSSEQAPTRLFWPCPSQARRTVMDAASESGAANAQRASAGSTGIIRSGAVSGKRRVIAGGPIRRSNEPAEAMSRLDRRRRGTAFEPQRGSIKPGRGRRPSPVPSESPRRPGWPRPACPAGGLSESCKPPPGSPHGVNRHCPSAAQAALPCPATLGGGGGEPVHVPR